MVNPNKYLIKLHKASTESSTTKNTFNLKSCSQLVHFRKTTLIFTMILLSCLVLEQIEKSSVKLVNNIIWIFFSISRLRQLCTTTNYWSKFEHIGRLETITDWNFSFPCNASSDKSGWNEAEYPLVAHNARKILVKRQFTLLNQ